MHSLVSDVEISVPMTHDIFRGTTPMSVKCLWIWFSAKCNSCVWPMWESCLSVTLIFIVSSLLSLHSRVQAAAGGICLCLLPLSSCGASLPLQNLAIFCLVTLSFSSHLAFTMSKNEKRQDFSVCSSLTDKPILFSHSHQSTPSCVSLSRMTVRLCISVANLHKHSMMNYT